MAVKTREVATGLAVGIGLIALTPLVLPAAAAMAGPLGRAAAKTGGVLYEKTRETFAELGEIADDFVAEAKDEWERRGQLPEAPDAPAATGAPEGAAAEPVEPA